MDSAHIKFIPLPLLLLASLGALSQSFTQTIGGASAQDGVGAMPLAAGYLVGVCDNDVDIGSHIGRVYDMSAGGGLLGIQDLVFPGPTFLQGMANATDGSAFLFGSVVPTGSNEHQGMIAKYAVNGDLSWTALDSAGGSHQFLGAAALPDGGVLACGVSTVNGGHDALVVRFNSAGALLWTRTVESATDEEAHAVAVEGDDVILAGRSTTFSGASDMLFARLDLEGNVIWNTSWGGTVDEEGRAIVSNGNGSFVAVGYTTSYGPLSPVLNATLAQVYIVSVDLQGDTLWTRTIGDEGSFLRAYSVVKASNGDLLIAGETGTIGESDALLFRLSAVGDMIWERAIHTGKEERIVHLLPLNDGMIGTGWSSGEFGRQLLFIRRNADGN